MITQPEFHQRLDVFVKKIEAEFPTLRIRRESPDTVWFFTDHCNGIIGIRIKELTPKTIFCPDIGVTSGTALGGGLDRVEPGLRDYITIVEVLRMATADLGELTISP